MLLQTVCKVQHQGHDRHFLKFLTLPGNTYLQTTERGEIYIKHARFKPHIDSMINYTSERIYYSKLTCEPHLSFQLLPAYAHTVVCKVEKEQECTVGSPELWHIHTALSSGPG